MSFLLLLVVVELCQASIFLTQTRSTILINRTSIGNHTECAIRLGSKDFQLKFYRMITCRHVESLDQIVPFVSNFIHEINALEITESNVRWSNLIDAKKVFHRLEFVIFHRTTLTNFSCPLNIFAKKLFYFHLIDFSPSLDQLVSHRSCWKLKRVHALILDQTPVGNVDVLREKFPHLHLLRLNFSATIQPLNDSYLRSFAYLNDFLLKTNEDCHRCEYEWLKYATRNINPFLFRISSQSGCYDWQNHGEFLPWHRAPLCGSCSLPLIRNGRLTNELCRMEDGISEYYCQAFYGRRSQFQLWENQLEEKTTPWIPFPPTRRPQREYLKPTKTRRSIVDKTWPSRLVVTRESIDLFNRSFCHPTIDNPYRPRIHSKSPSLNEQMINISKQFASNCSEIQCSSNQSNSVCLKNGQTFKSLCDVILALCTEQLDSTELEIDYFGNCVENCSLVKRCYSDDEICVMTPKPHCIRRERNCTGFSPVCDTYGKTFLNQCHLSNSLRLSQPRQMAYEGPCRLKRRCSDDLCRANEICLQTDDQFHYPVCLNCHFNQTQSNNCPFELFCGDNRRQYISRCQLHFERCQSRTFIQIDYSGSCLSDQNDVDEDF